MARRAKHDGPLPMGLERQPQVAEHVVHVIMTRSWGGAFCRPYLLGDDEPPSFEPNADTIAWMRARVERRLQFSAEIRLAAFVISQAYESPSDTDTLILPKSGIVLPLFRRLSCILIDPGAEPFDISPLPDSCDESSIGRAMTADGQLIDPLFRLPISVRDQTSYPLGEAIAATHAPGAATPIVAMHDKLEHVVVIGPQ